MRVNAISNDGGVALLTRVPGLFQPQVLGHGAQAGRTTKQSTDEEKSLEKS